MVQEIWGDKEDEHSLEERDMIPGDEAVVAGARRKEACEILELDLRTAQRWRRQDVGDDRRAGPKAPPANKLSTMERNRVLATANLPSIGI